ncbi:hypothetical protein OKW38_004243 [Paraburkholderia sp. MM5496-R1]|uniref:hypothetical protein n=1 Tax=Paraburkholderia sp. MM5496-R1 TaxID=2991065 RepID=UPI003D1A6605
MSVLLLMNAYGRSDGGVRVPGIHAKAYEVKRLAARAGRRGNPGLMTVALVLEMQRQREAYMLGREMRAREQAAMALPLQADAEVWGGEPIRRERRGKRWDAERESRVRNALWRADSYASAEVHPWMKPELAAEWEGLSWEQRTVWRRITSACFGEVRGWDRWPEFMRPKQTSSRGKGLSLSKRTPPADDKAHRFGTVWKARQTFEALKKTAEQREAVRLWTMAEGRAPLWAVPRTGDKPGRKIKAGGPARKKTR